MNRAELQTLGDVRIAEAQVLLAAGMFDGAYYRHDSLIPSSRRDQWEMSGGLIRSGSSVKPTVSQTSPLTPEGTLVGFTELPLRFNPPYNAR